MRDKEIKEGLADLAQRAEMDHEVQMARSDLYKIAKYAIKLHEMLKNVSEAEGLEGWQITPKLLRPPTIWAVYIMQWIMICNLVNKLNQKNLLLTKKF